ncbi:adenylate/guanylate cyclase domain-containing protein [Sulfitobacter aestuariivivens]|uniref:adenylate/guanylate cyclase domain-containing protein n=1 Tax=Sulfitobacter aestuariivivens TaxID=2766981 RepID=UPI00362058FA
MEQTLVAVMAVDVVGYSRMMGADATGTIASLGRIRQEVFAPVVAGYRGRIVKNMGDGWIVTFASATEAATCAMRLQDKMVLERDIQIRIGVHLGDVTVMDEDVFGDGVNVAARLEAAINPGAEPV